MFLLSNQDEESYTPQEFKLEQNFPNSVYVGSIKSYSTTTTIQFALAEDGLTTPKIYDNLGCEIKN